MTEPTHDPDEHLLRSLRNSKGWPTLGNAAADRIEELEAKHQEAFQMYVDANEARIDAEAKMAQVEYVLRQVSQSLAWRCFGECRGFSEDLLSPKDATELSRATLAAIKETPPDAHHIADIRKMVAAERERCAKVAFDAGCGWQALRTAALSSSWPEDVAKHLASEHAAFAIAAAIRKGGE